MAEKNSDLLAFLMVHERPVFPPEKCESCFRLPSIEKLNNYDFSVATKVPFGNNPNRQGMRRVTRPGSLEPLVSFS